MSPEVEQDLTVCDVEKLVCIVHRVFLGSVQRNQGVLGVIEDPVSHSDLHSYLCLQEAQLSDGNKLHLSLI